MKKIINKLGGIVLCLAELAVGILLLIEPVGFTSGIIIALGVLLCAFGIINAVRYFRTDAQEASVHYYLSVGLVLLTAGTFCILRHGWFIATFPVLTILYGVLVLVTGIAKLQWVVDILRLKKKYWYVAALDSVISIIFGVIILMDPFATTAVLWTFVAVSLIIEAVMDVVMFIVSGKVTISAEEKAAEEVEVEAAEETEE